MRVVFMGPPGAGKGTQVEIFAARLGVPHLGTGIMLRAEIASGSELGKRIAAVIDAGHLVDDAMALSLVEGKLDPTGYILDGLPRTLPQAVALDAMTVEHPIQAVIKLHIEEDALLERMENRVRQDLKAGRTPRPDDTPDIFKGRQRAFRELTAPVYGHYASQGKLIEIDGMATPSEVTEAISLALVGLPR